MPAKGMWNGICCNPVISKMVVTMTQVTAALITTPASLFSPFRLSFTDLSTLWDDVGKMPTLLGKKSHPRNTWSLLPVEIHHLLLKWPSANTMPQTPCAALLKAGSAEMKHVWKQFHGHRERWNWRLLKFTIDLEKQIQSGTRLTVTKSTIARK